MRQHTRLALVTFFAMAAASCATMTAGFHADHGTNLAADMTWDWGLPDALPAGDPRLTDNTFFQDHFEGAVEKRLATLGFIRAPEGVTPALLVHYHANIARRFLVNESAVNCVPGDCQPQTIEYEQGTLVLDVMDVKHDKLVWRGWAQDNFERSLKSPDRLERQINDAVAKILEHFTTGVSSHLQPGVTFMQYRTWDWGPADSLPTGDPRLDSNSIFKDHLEGALEKALARHGFTRVSAGTAPQILIHYHASVNQRMQVSEPEGNCTVDCKPSVMEYDQGTLVIDLMDARTRTLLWRGLAQDSVNGVIDNQPLMERKIDEAVTKMMARFPKS